MKTMFHGWIVAAGQQELRSDSLELRGRPFVGNVSGVERRFWLDENDVDFFVGDGEMFDAARDDDEFPFAHERFIVAEFHAQHAFDNEKQLIFLFVMVPDEFALQFHGFDVTFVHLTDDSGFPVIGEEAEFFMQINSFHCAPYRV
jgi:hypothetical protein